MQESGRRESPEQVDRNNGLRTCGEVKTSEEEERVDVLHGVEVGPLRSLNNVVVEVDPALGMQADILLVGKDLRGIFHRSKKFNISWVLITSYPMNPSPSTSEDG